MSALAGIKLGLCDREVIEAQLNALELDTNGSTKHVVERLAKYFKKGEANKVMELVVCDNCKAESDATLTHCPFCGDEGTVNEGPMPSSMSSMDDVDEPEVHPIDDDGIGPGDEESDDTDDEESDDEESDDTDDEESDDEESEDSGDEDADDTGDDVDGVASNDEDAGDDAGESDDAGDAGEEEGEVMATATAAKKTGKTATKKASGKAATAARVGKLPPKGKAPKEAATEPTEPGTAIAPRPVGRPKKVLAPLMDAEGTIVLSVDLLDEQIAIVREASVAGAQAQYRFGMAIQKIAEEKLWMLRVDDEGVPKFRSFQQFCKEELATTRMSAHRALDVVKEFKDESELENLSTRQVRLILDVPKEKRGEMIEAAKSGEAGAKLSERADKLRGGREKLPEPKKGTVVNIVMGRSRLKMYKRPTSGTAKVGDTTDAVRAKKISDSPWCVMDLPNKVRMLIRFGLDKQGEALIAEVEFRKGEPAL
jgi:hypothetical protein